MTSIRNLRPRAFVVLGSVVLVGGFLIAGVAWSWRWLPALGSWVNGFVTSPGFGALAAVIAAGIAYNAATRRISHDQQVERAREDEARREAESQRWQELLMWVAANIATADAEQMVRICEELARQAHTESQRGILAAIVADRLDQDDEGDGF